MSREKTLRLIDRAVECGMTALNLSDPELTEVPPEIGRLTGVTVLQFLDTPITSLPPEIGQLTNLTRLDLWGSRIVSLPTEICRLPNLKRLDLSSNGLRGVPPEIFQLTNLIELCLGKGADNPSPPRLPNRLPALPPEIGQLTRLQKLDVRGNLLRQLPDEIGQLTQLSDLNLSANALAALPAQIGRLGQLTSLNLNDNRLTTLPAEVGQLTNLQQLFLADNHLTELPPEIGRLSALRYLLLSANHLSDLPAEFGALARLEWLKLTGNRFAHLPPVVGRLTHLSMLEMDALSSPPPDVTRQGIPAILMYLQAQLPDAIRAEYFPRAALGEMADWDIRELVVHTQANSFRSLQRLHQVRKRVHWLWRGRTIQEWIDVLAESPRNEDWKKAYRTLQDFGVSAVPALMKGLIHGKSRVRQSVAGLLAELGPRAVCARHRLVQALRDPVPKVRQAVVEALRCIGDGAHEAVPAILQRLTTDPDARVRELAAQTLHQLGAQQPGVLSGLIHAIDDVQASVRAAAAEALGHLAGRESIGKLLEEQFIIDDETRPQLAAALARVAPDRLVQLARSQPDLFSPDSARERTVDQAAAMLMRLAALGAEAAPVRHLFVHMLGTPVRDAALYALSRIGGAARDTIPAIVRSRDELAAKALGQLKPDNPTRRAEKSPAADRALARTLGKSAVAALRAIHFSGWLEDDRQVRARRKHWRRPMLHRFRERWRQQPIGATAQQLVEDAVRRHSRSRILVTRLQTGDLDRKRIELAALLGDRDSLCVLGLRCPNNVDDLDQCAFASWTEELAAQPPEVRARFGHAVARDVLHLWQDEYLRDDCVADLVHALEDWLCVPTRESMARLHRASEFHISQFCTPLSFAAGWAVRAAATFTEASQLRSALRHALAAWQATDGTALGWYFGKSRPFDPLPADRAIARIRRVIRAAVVPWALAEGDPVREALAQLVTDYPQGADSEPRCS